MMQKIDAVTGYITPIESTRLRVVPETYSTVIGTFPANAIVEIDQTILYTENDPAKPAIWAGDLWGRVIKIAGTPITQPAFMAITYHNAAICSKHYSPAVPPVDPPPSDPPAIVRPSMVLVGPAGNQWRYIPDPDQTKPL